MEAVHWWTILVMDFALRLGLSIRVVMRRLPIGVSLAWIVIVLMFPFAGAIAYLLLGELRLGVFRAPAPLNSWRPTSRGSTECMSGMSIGNRNPPLPRPSRECVRRQPACQ